MRHTVATPTTGYGMDKSSSPERTVLPSHSRPLPLTALDGETGSSAPTSARSSFEQLRSADSKRTSFPIETTPLTGPKEIILKAFLPRVAVHASPDTEELIRLKGIYGGLCGLLRPFGETVTGRVGIRDSAGISKSWDDFGVFFVPLEKQQSPAQASTQTSLPRVEDSIQEGDWSRILKAAPDQEPLISALDEIVSHSLNEWKQSEADEEDADLNSPPYYNLFLRKILADRPLTPYETFSHPVACVIAISSQTPNPITTLGDLYHYTRADGGSDLPYWVNNGFLRYYVLLHDEDNDDLTTSTNLFAQMKRHFGLHCHMLRLRSVECTSQEADGSPLPPSNWLSANEDVAEFRQNQGAAGNDLQQYLFDSDASVIRTFVRELVTQSIVPYMENRVTTWNDQEASRRRGVTGRLMSMSKRWTGLGMGRNKSSQANAADKDFDPTQGAYKPDSAAATMHRLADYAFMLRDWKLASSIYDFLRSDFSDDKAWHHYAQAHEMAAISLLLSGHSRSSRGRIETINQLLDTAIYSFITRCSNPHEASRCMIAAVELFINNGGLGRREASRWGKRLLELSIVSPLVQALLSERLSISTCYRPGWATEAGADPVSPTLYRRSALWSVIGAESWTRLSQTALAARQLHKAITTYELQSEEEFAAFEGTKEYLQDLGRKIATLDKNSVSTVGQEPDTFIEDMSFPSEAEQGKAGKHHHSHSVVHRRGLSQQNVLSTIGRPEDSLQTPDDGFS